MFRHVSQTRGIRFPRAPLGRKKKKPFEMNSEDEETTSLSVTSNTSQPDFLNDCCSESELVKLPFDACHHSVLSRAALFH